MKKPTILILHGWGVSGDAYSELVKLLKEKGFTVFAPDLPGFGKESLPKEVMILDDYVDFVKNFIRDSIDGKYILIGHSFGGRIAIKLAASNPGNLSKLILTGAAGIRHPLPLRSKMLFFIAKSGKLIHAISPLHSILRKILYHSIGEFDYFKAGELKETFKRIIKEDLSAYLPKISIPTLLVWGEHDLAIPVSDADYMHKHIKESKLVIVKGAVHSFVTTMPHVFVEKILPFLEND